MYRRERIAAKEIALGQCLVGIGPIAVTVNSTTIEAVRRSVRLILFTVANAAVLVLFVGSHRAAAATICANAAAPELQEDLAFNAFRNTPSFANAEAVVAKQDTVSAAYLGCVDAYSSAADYRGMSLAILGAANSATAAARFAHAIGNDQNAPEDLATTMRRHAKECLEDAQSDYQSASAVLADHQDSELNGAVGQMRKMIADKLNEIRDLRTSWNIVD